MKIAILSDSHDNIVNVRTAVSMVQDMGAEALLFCGDFCAPGSAKAVAEFDGAVYVVFGNNDGDKMNIARLMNETSSRVKFFEESNGVLELDGRRIAMTHYPRYADALARTGDYDLVAFGHDHKGRIEQHGNCFAVNPGCLNPMVARGNTLGFAVYDTQAHQAVIYNIDGKIL